MIEDSASAICCIVRHGRIPIHHQIPGHRIVRRHLRGTVRRAGSRHVGDSAAKAYAAVVCDRRIVIHGKFAEALIVHTAAHISGAVARDGGCAVHRQRSDLAVDAASFVLRIITIYARVSVHHDRTSGTASVIVAVHIIKIASHAAAQGSVVVADAGAVIHNQASVVPHHNTSAVGGAVILNAGITVHRQCPVCENCSAPVGCRSVPRLYLRVLQHCSALQRERSALLHTDQGYLGRQLFSIHRDSAQGQRSIAGYRDQIDRRITLGSLQRIPRDGQRFSGDRDIAVRCHRFEQFDRITALRRVHRFLQRSVLFFSDLRGCVRKVLGHLLALALLHHSHHALRFPPRCHLALNRTCLGFLRFRLTGGQFHLRGLRFRLTGGQFHLRRLRFCLTGGQFHLRRLCFCLAGGRSLLLLACGAVFLALFLLLYSFRLLCTPQLVCINVSCTLSCNCKQHHKCQ